MKKYIAWDVFHLSLILSLIRLYPELYRSSSLQNLEPLSREEILGPSSAYTQTNFHQNLNNRLHGYIHPKNFDDSIARTLFINDLNSLVNRPNWELNPPQNNIFAYILNDQLPPVSGLDQSTNNNRTAVNSDNSSVTNQSQVLPSLGFPAENSVVEAELSQDDMDLIEILWKQDIDLGISRDVYDGTWNEENHKNQETFKESTLKSQSENASVEESNSFSNPWEGLSYIIDSETGEHIVSSSSPSDNVSQAFQEVPSDEYNHRIFEEAFQLFENDELSALPALKYDGQATAATNFNFTPALNETEFDRSLYSPEYEVVPIPSSALPSYPLTLDAYDIEERSGSLLDQLQDISDLALEARVLNETHASRFSENTFHQNAYNTNNTTNMFPMGASNVNFSAALIQNTTLPLPLDNQTNAADLIDDFLLSLIANGSDVPDTLPLLSNDQYNDIPVDFLNENMSFENDFLTSFFNEEVMNLMDTNIPASVVKEELNLTQPQASNDSAVSSMGSENEWNDEAVSYQGVQRNWNQRSDQGSHENSSSSSVSYSGADNSMDVGACKQEQKYNSRDSSANGYTSDSGCGKSHLTPRGFDGATGRVFGSVSRFADHSKGHSKSASNSNMYAESRLHNHTYSYPHDIPRDDDATETPFERDKKYSEGRKWHRKSTSECLDDDENAERCRDEALARELNLPITVKEITSLPIDEFNERLTKFDLNEEQLTLVRDIRRRGKNKIAAQNCRKRKMDQIFELQHTLEDLELEREKLSDEQSVVSQRRDYLQSKFNKLYKFICDMGPHPGPPDPPGYFPGNSRGPRGHRQSQEFPLSNNSTAFNSHDNLGNGRENSGHGGAIVKRKVNKNN